MVVDVREGVEFSDGNGVYFVELGDNEQDGTDYQFPIFIVERHPIGQELIKEGNSKEESAPAEF
jgi:hypothetical protein